MNSWEKLATKAPLLRKKWIPAIQAHAAHASNPRPMSITQQVLPTSRPPIAKPQNQPNQPSIQSSFRNSHESETTKQTANSQLVAIGQVHQIWTVSTTLVKLLIFLFLISFVASVIPNNGVLLACPPWLRCLSCRYCSSLTVPEASRKFMCT